MATNFLMFCSTISEGLDLALGAGAVGFEFAAGVVSMYTWSAEGGTGSGYLVSWAVAVVSKSIGFGRMTFFLGTSTAFVLLPSSVNKEMISS